MDVSKTQKICLDTSMLATSFYETNVVKIPIMAYVELNVG
jgi:hypothetical protein